MMNQFVSPWSYFSNLHHHACIYVKLRTCMCASLQVPVSTEDLSLVSTRALGAVQIADEVGQLSLDPRTRRCMDDWLVLSVRIWSKHPGGLSFRVAE